jgi:hypothetical protein
MSGFLYGTTGASGNFNFTAQVRDAAGNASQRAFTLVVRSGTEPLSAADAQYKKKKVIVNGDGFREGAVVYVDGEGLEVGAFDVTRLATVKRKQKSGLHEVYVVNPDGRRSNTLQFVVE